MLARGIRAGPSQLVLPATSGAIAPPKRLLHASAVSLVKRRQVPFDFHLPPDPIAVKNRNLTKSMAKQLKEYKSLEDAPVRSGSAKFSNVEFGLRAPPDIVVRETTRPMSFHERHTGKLPLNSSFAAIKSRFRNGVNPAPELFRMTEEDLYQLDVTKRRDRERRDIAASRKRDKMAEREERQAGIRRARADRVREKLMLRAESQSQKAAWKPTKKLTFAAMAGIRELHAQDPEQWTRTELSSHYGISVEAVTRILRSKWHNVQEGVRDGGDAKSKWDTSSTGANTSPVQHIRRAYALKRSSEAKTKADDRADSGVRLERFDDKDAADEYKSAKSFEAVKPVLDIDAEWEDRQRKIREQRQKAPRRDGFRK